MDAAAAKRRNFRLLLQTKNNFLSRPMKRLAQQEVQLSCFLLASENSDQMIRFNLFRFLSGNETKHRKAKKGHGWTKLERIEVDCIWVNLKNVVMI